LHVSSPIDITRASRNDIVLVHSAVARRLSYNVSGNPAHVVGLPRKTKYTVAYNPTKLAYVVTETSCDMILSLRHEDTVFHSFSALCAIIFSAMVKQLLEKTPLVYEHMHSHWLHSDDSTSFAYYMHQKHREKFDDVMKFAHPHFFHEIRNKIIIEIAHRRENGPQSTLFLPMEASQLHAQFMKKISACPKFSSLLACQFPPTPNLNSVDVLMYICGLFGRTVFKSIHNIESWRFNTFVVRGVQSTGKTVLCNVLKNLCNGADISKYNDASQVSHEASFYYVDDFDNAHAKNPSLSMAANYVSSFKPLVVFTKRVVSSLGSVPGVYFGRAMHISEVAFGLSHKIVKHELPAVWDLLFFAYNALVDVNGPMTMSIPVYADGLSFTYWGNTAHVLG
jgi:hypothetical protein